MTLSQFCVARTFRQLQEAENPDPALLEILNNRMAVYRAQHRESEESEAKTPLIPFKDPLAANPMKEAAKR